MRHLITNPTPFQATTGFPCRDVIAYVHCQEETHLEVLLERGMRPIFNGDHTFELLVFRVAVGEVAGEVNLLNLEWGIVRPTLLLQFVDHVASQKPYSGPINVERRRLVGLSESNTERAILFPRAST